MNNTYSRIKKTFAIGMVGVCCSTILSVSSAEERSVKEIAKGFDISNVQASAVEGVELRVSRGMTEVMPVVPQVDVDMNVKENIVKEKVIKAPFDMNELGDFSVRGYCSCSECKSNAVDNSKMRDYEGVNIAVNPSEIPFGTKVYIEGVGIRQAQPSSQKVNKGEILVYFKDHSSVKSLGVKSLKVYKIEE